MSKPLRDRSRTSIGATRSPATETAIVEAADRVLRLEGVDGFTIESVAREARASKPTIYRWWGDKLRLILDVHWRKHKVVDGSPDLGSLREDLVFLLRQLWHVHWADPQNARISRALMAEALRSETVLRDYRDGYLARRAEPFLAAFAQAKARGELPADADENYHYEVLLGYHLMRLMLQRPVSSDEIEAFVDHLLHQKLQRAPG